MFIRFLGWLKQVSIDLVVGLVTIILFAAIIMVLALGVHALAKYFGLDDRIDPIGALIIASVVIVSIRLVGAFTIDRLGRLF